MSAATPSASPVSLARRAPDGATLTAVLGPTNTGKTHLAIERMLGRDSGIMGLPLRLLAREVYDRVVAAKGKGAAALITGEEKIAPPGARYFICTVEAMPSTLPDGRPPAFVGVDEVQLCADPDRGHVFTDRMLNARGRDETMLMGADTMTRLIRTLAPEATHQRRERMSELSHAGSKKLTKLSRRTAVVGFSAQEVYAVAELLRRQRGGAAVVLGALSPRTRNAQVELYQSGDVDFLVATDAIGMGLNMDVDHVAFSSLVKFDGRRRRPLRPHEIAQIAGRAGRHIRDGTFGTTGDARPLPDDVAHQIMEHRFDPVRAVQWRASDLQFDTVAQLVASLSAPSPHPALKPTRDASDETALRSLADDNEIQTLARGREAVKRLWAACQIPDFRKVTIDQHVRLIEAFARHLLSDRGALPESWAGAAIAKLDNVNGDVDALSARLAHIRTWTYAANRADWFEDAAHWRGVAHGVEDRLSDALHERLTQRFVDKRTSALIRSLNAEGVLEAHVSKAGEVEVEGHFVGRLEGLTFRPDHRGRELEGRALRAAALKALRPEIDRRLGAIARAADEAFTLQDDLSIRWSHQGATAIIARLARGKSELNPSVTLIGAEQAPAPIRQRAERRLESWLQSLISRHLGPLRTLEDAMNTGALTGLARGLAFRLLENLGWLDRTDVADDLHALSAQERRALRAFGARFGAYAVFFPALVRPKPARLCALLLATGPRTAGAPFLPTPGRTSVPIQKSRPALAYAAAGYRACGPLAVRHDALEKLADHIRTAQLAAPAGDKPQPPRLRAFALTPAMTGLLGCTNADLASVMQALGYRKVAPPRRQPSETGDAAPAAPSDSEAAVPDAEADNSSTTPPPVLWRAAGRRRSRPGAPAPRPTAPQASPTDTPFAALVSLAPPTNAAPAHPAPRKRRGKKRRRPAGDATRRPTGDPSA